MPIQISTRTDSELADRRFEKRDAENYLKLFQTEAFLKYCYRVPVKTSKEVKRWCKNRYYTVETRREVFIGYYTLTPVSTCVATFGLCIISEAMGRGYGSQILDMIEHRAGQLGYLNLRPDIFEDNPFVDTLINHGYRKYVLLEKAVEARR